MMKLVVLLAGLALVSAAVPRPDNTPTYQLGAQNYHLSSGGAERGLVESTERSVILSNRIMAFVESYREDIANGNSIHPPLDPFQQQQIGPIVLGTDNLLVRVRAILNNLNVRGINSFVVEDLVFSLLRMNLNFHLTIPNVVVQSQYNVEARLALFVSHRATGLATIIVRGVKVNGFMQLGIVDGSLNCSELDLQLEIDNTTVNLTELTGVEAVDLILNWIVQNVTSDIIQESQDHAGVVISAIIKDLVNEILGNYTLEDLLG